MSPMPMMFDEGPLKAKAALDSVNPLMADRVDDWLDMLEEDHTQADVRRQRLHQPKLWMITVRATDGDDWVILWELVGDTVWVRYIGPDFVP